MTGRLSELARSGLICTLHWMGPKVETMDRSAAEGAGNGRSDGFAIVARGVGVQKEDRWILKDVDWTVPTGACVAILGPNGSGKSSLARVISGYLWPTEGEVSVLGEVFGSVNLHELRESLRLVQPIGQAEPAPEMTALQVALTGAFGTVGLYSEPPGELRAEAERLLGVVGLRSVMGHPYRTLSNGERIRCLIARALVRKPRLLLLDEPTAGLDLLAREQVLATIESLFRSGDERPTVVLITHHLEELPPAVSRVMVLDEGKVAAEGTPEEVLTSELLSAVYRCPLDVVQSNGRYYSRVSPGAWDALLASG
ncbi:ABC-type molybdenum transport system, ATPase component/photorepair protein PhrA [Singulisphaera acidiphila DSM 18658]|uniref:ABC-type molybdenum transport system, ATPase component/photorepair protein PhrA n=2 Tax=Singulisphaera acidiphila TaxID=466153 RepID=L0DDD0_SINAD|nr:ABC-type molybdenum transport system, ATPase component/photorepair protein PhrA [Singulisphaera acidiphila DSM 18658]